MLLPGPEGTHIYMKITMLSPFPSTSKSPLLPRCAERAVSGWHICLSLSIHWQIYQENVHLWWACFYIWAGEVFSEPKQRRRKKNAHEDRLRIYDAQYVCTTHTPTQIYSRFTQSITTTSTSSGPAGLLRYRCQTHAERSLHLNISLNRERSVLL